MKWFMKAADFINILEDDHPRLSWTKLGLVGGTLVNVANGLAQVGDQIRSMLMDTPAHASIPALAATSFAHALAAWKSESKRRINAKGD